MRLFKLPKNVDTLKEPVKISRRLNPPAGLVFKIDDDYFLIKSGKKLRFYSERVFLSWCYDYITASPEALAGLKLAGTIGFRDGSLVKNFVDGKIYLVSDNRRRLITDPDLMILLGNKSIDASLAEINLQDEGEPLDAI